MADFEEADQRLMDWLTERTDTQLQRLLDAPEDGLTNDDYDVEGGCGCLAGWAFGLETSVTAMEALNGPAAMSDAMLTATGILCEYGLYGGSLGDDGTIMRRIQGFAAAEMLTRRVERKALPAPTRESVPA